MSAEHNTREIPEVISFRTIRRSVGFLGLLLPVGLYLEASLLGCSQLQDSISHYYFTIAGSLLVGALCAVGLFLISYKGFSPKDDRATNFAGICAFGVAFFPTSKDEHSFCDIVAYPESGIRVVIHYSWAALLFLTLAYISYFLFTISKGEKTEEKTRRNKVYRTTAVLMILFVVLIPILSLDSFEDVIGKYHPTFWLESGALISFGISWLVKGEIVLEDKPRK